MSERVISFVEEWVTDNVHAEGYEPEGDNTLAAKLAKQCRTEAIAAGIPASEIDDEFNDLTAFMSAQIVETNDREGGGDDDGDDGADQS